jgi:hypothetical protein
MPDDADKPRVPLSVLERIVRDLAIRPGWDDRDSRAALVLLAPFSIESYDPDAVSRFTGVPSPVVREMYRRLEEDGWRPDGGGHAGWADPELGNRAFLRDISVASGKPGRAKRREVVMMPPSGVLQ